MSFKNIILSERSQTQKSIYCITLFIQKFRKFKLINNSRKQIRSFQGQRIGKIDHKKALGSFFEGCKYSIHCYQVSLGVQICQNSLNCTLLSGYMHVCLYTHTQDFPGGASGKEPVCQCRRLQRLGLISGSGSWRRKQQPTPVFLPGESHGQRSLAGYGRQDCKELDVRKVTQHAL